MQYCNKNENSNGSLTENKDKKVSIIIVFTVKQLAGK